jgi:hypothetical protein
MGPLGQSLSGVGDLAFAPDGRLYGILERNVPPDLLVSIDPVTGAGSIVSPPSGVGFANVYGLTFVGPDLFAVTTGGSIAGVKGQLLRLSLTTGIASFVRNLTFSASGAADPPSSIVR